MVDTDYSYPLLSVFWTLLWFFLFILWFYLLFAVVSDILLSHDLSGWGKAAWIVVAILFPFFGILIYLVVRGGGMHERAVERAARQDQALRDQALRNYVPTNAGTVSSPADELGRLAELRDRGVISDEEYQRLKARVLA
nr:SHOCT domain-containing protein [Protofrankia symbiont of Coriaria ruscifolia]